MSTFCSTKTGTVGTSTNCSASCRSRIGVRGGMLSWLKKILGTSITCSTTGSIVSKILRTSTNWSTICGTGTSRIGTSVDALLLFQRRLKCAVCMTTKDQRCNESLRQIYVGQCLCTGLPTCVKHGKNSSHAILKQGHMPVRRKRLLWK